MFELMLAHLRLRLLNLGKERSFTTLQNLFIVAQLPDVSSFISGQQETNGNRTPLSAKITAITLPDLLPLRVLSKTCSGNNSVISHTKQDMFVTLQHRRDDLSSTEEFL